jgi:hypothetical protein
MTLNRYAASLGLIIQYLGNALDVGTRILRQIGLAEFEQDIGQIHHHSTLCLARLKIPFLQLFEESTVARDFLSSLFNLLLIACDFIIPFLKPVTHHRTSHAAQGAANSRTRPRAAERRPNNRASCGTQACAS